ncbi:MAG TPA: AAA domain-containing protein [Verrucomicrobiales bacterium]|nr:AAA domain-containing protein [Verrucomicrobiales bacterium]
MLPAAGNGSTLRGMILHAMLQRLYASLVHGPSMNARPHRSRQRCDLMELGSFRGTDPVTAMRELLEKGRLEFPAKVPPFTAPSADSGEDSPSRPGKSPELTPEQKAARDAWLAQSRLLKKLRDIAEDATNYVNDHGESCLAVGFPLLSMPASAEDSAVKGSSRILAPLLLVPLTVQVRTASRAGVTLHCAADGADRLVANPALLAWLERQTGKMAGDLFLDEEASDPWREVADLLTRISTLLGFETPATFTAESILTEVPSMDKLPKGVAVMPSAVLGLFPLSNQSLLRDTRWMLDNQPALVEPVSSFLSPQALQNDNDTPSQDPVVVQQRDFTSEWLVSAADPCQANAVLAAREAKALVVHGPPGTGKSQTITNMIADHLARRQRVLFVCDKRTALDVVKYRLDAVGLGDFCGLVHDPGADRKDFYMGLRGQLENLADTPVPEDPRAPLQNVNQQLSAVHSELESCRKKLHGSPDGTAQSFHELLGTWMALAAGPGLPDLPPDPAITSAAATAAHTTLEEIARRAENAGYAENPLRGLHGIPLSELLQRSTSDVRTTFSALLDAARSADTARPAPDAILDSNLSLTEQESRLRTAATALRTLDAAPDQTAAQKALGIPEQNRKSFAAEFEAASPMVEQLHQPLDRSLLTSARSAGVLTLPQVNQHLSALGEWEAVAGSFIKRLFAGKTKKAAIAALTPLGLNLREGAVAAKAFYAAAKSRLLLTDFAARITGDPGTAFPEDTALSATLQSISTAWKAASAWEAVRNPESLPGPGQRKGAATALDGAATWAASLEKLRGLVVSSGLFNDAAPAMVVQRWAAGESAAKDAAAWLEAAPSLEHMVRLSTALDQLPAALRSGADALALQGAGGEDMRDAFAKVATGNELRSRLQSDSELMAIDGDRIEAAFNSYLTLSRRKMELVKTGIRHTWLTHQRDRLLSSTGSQLNRHGSSLRQRLYVKGKKALKLRQMLATGEGADGGDPIYDLCPVWMASPSTVAQIFPRHAIFDVVIFDEASQCRLEEALPVLLRGQRVVIAGDQKQLPPTRFFESALSDSSDSEAETAEELFYQQQSDAEDLLTAALNLDVREAYLDVHYRSRNESLIGFSNQQYYGSRLQPIPGHPRNKALSTPIQLHRVNGVYEERANVKEAEAAVALVADLLAETEPPSIGLACFNLTQRDAILDALEAKCGADEAFARRLETARKRKGRDSFEGLFVKNLENVQGDERDVMIICTTFGPDPNGKFRRNFGVLSQMDGGRRLNVLVTRARTAIHVLTSIPVAEYSAVEETPPGTVPNGRLQLYAYLRYAESLARLYSEYQDELERMKRDTLPELKVWPSATPSRLAAAMGRSLLDDRNTGSHVHWGNDGFCVDVACIHPLMPADVTVGVLTDFSRFHKTPDPVEWDLFRAQVLRNQGWELQRVWSPVLFRKREETLAAISAAHERLSQPPSMNPAVEAAES